MCYYYPSPWWQARLALALLLLVMTLSWLEPEHAKLLSWLNWVVVKGGWLITSITTISMIVCLPVGGKGVRPLWQDGVAWLGATGWWAAGTRLFTWLAARHGECLPLPAEHADQCRGVWRGFDISGHCFLLSLSLLMLTEYGWALGSWLRLWGKGWRRPLAAMILAWALILAMAWLFLLGQTALFYHTLEEKVLGVILGSGYWVTVAFILDQR